MTCKAIRQQDEMFCPLCDLRWDAADMFPPRCGRRRLVIGIAGRAGSGKSTMAQMIRRDLGQVSIEKFARPLKAGTRGLLIDAGYSSDEAERAIEGDLKNQRDLRLGGISPRELMQGIGSGVRNQVGNMVWVNMWSERVLKIRHHVIVDDVRYANEAERVRQVGGRVIMITGRADADVSSEHESERFEFEPDMTYHNTGSFVDMHEWLRNHVTRG